MTWNWLGRMLIGDAVARRFEDLEGEIESLRDELTDKASEIEKLRLVVVGLQRQIEAEAAAARKTGIALFERIERLRLGKTSAAGPADGPPAEESRRA